MEALVLSDIHANATALEAVLERETTYDVVVCLGDVVDGGPHPNRVLTMLSAESGYFIAGNHDRTVLNAGSNAGAAETPGDRLREWTYQQLSRSNRAFLSSFRPPCVETVSGRITQLHHGDFSVADHYPSFEERLWPDLDESIFSAIAGQFDSGRILHGHSHVQFQRCVDGTEFCNPGSVGQHRLGAVAAQYAVIVDGRVDFRSVAYDPTAVIDAMDAIPIDSAYIEDRKRIYTEGRLPESSSVPSLEHLEAKGYR